MGLKPRVKVAYLSQKLRQIREHLGLSQNEMLKVLGYEEVFDRSTISHYESGEREPPLPVLLAYARSVSVYVDELIDDKHKLFDKKLPDQN